MHSGARYNNICTGEIHACIEKHTCIHVCRQTGILLHQLADLLTAGSYGRSFRPSRTFARTWMRNSRSQHVPCGFCHTCSVAAFPNVLCAGFPTDIVDPKMGAVLSNRVQLWCLILCYRESVHASDSADISGVLLNPGGDSPSALVSRWSSFALPLHGVPVVS